MKTIKKMVKLINDERLNPKIASKKATEPDTCDSTSVDVCNVADYSDCTVYAYDWCNTDYRSCTEGADDYCFGNYDTDLCSGPGESDMN